jgi:hypothetical protein
MYKFFSILTTIFYTIIDISPLHYLYMIALSSGYIFYDYVTAKGTLNIFKRLKKVATVFRRQ